MLYEIETNPVDVEDAIRLYWEAFEPYPTDIARVDEIREFSNALLRGVMAHRDEIDKEIQSSSKNWKINRMALVDRNILRLAVYELAHCADIPKRVSINEAIELGKKFGSEDSGSFINGVLDKISHGIEKE